MKNIEHYFIILSEHNIAEYRACLYLQPQNIHLITTKHIASKGIHERFQNTLKHSPNFNGKIHDITTHDEHQLIGQRSTEIQQWIQQCLMPYLKQHNIRRKAILNITGGTKILSALLAQAHTWQELHYQAFLPDTDNLLIDRLRYRSRQGLCLLDELNEPQDFDLIEGLKLYAKNVSASHSNPIFQYPSSLSLAEQRFIAQNHTEGEYINPFSYLIPALTTWLEHPEQDYALAWRDIISKCPAADVANLQNFCEQLRNLIHFEVPNIAQYIIINQEHIRLPSLPKKKKNKLHKALKKWHKWLCGDWFEQLIQAWLRQSGVKESAIRTGVQISINESNGNETDILWFHKNQLHFLELKSDLSPQQSLTDFPKQLLIQSSELGLVKKILVLSPIIKRHKTPEQWAEFEKTCHDRNITIIIAHDQATLQKELRIKP